MFDVHFLVSSMIRLDARDQRRGSYKTSLPVSLLPKVALEGDDLQYTTKGGQKTCKEE